MSQVDNLLENLTDEQIQTYMANPVGEPHIIVDSNRNIVVPEELKRLGVQGDHNIERVTIECPQSWDGIDMSEMAIYINYMRPDNSTGFFIAENIVPNAETGIMCFDWVITKEVTMLPGNLKFLVCIRNVDENGEEHNHWNSELNTECYISGGLEVDHSLDDDTKYDPDVVSSLLTRLGIAENTANRAYERMEDVEERLAEYEAGQGFVSRFGDEFDGDLRMNGTLTLVNGMGAPMKTEVSHGYSSRATANGCEVVDGSTTEMKRIQGDTIKSENLLVNSKIQTVVSTGRNLLNVPENFTFTRAYQIYNMKLPAGTYYFNCESYTKGGANAPVMVVKDAVTSKDMKGFSADKGLQSITLPDGVYTIQFYSNGWNYPASEGITSTINKLMFCRESAMEYEPYTDDIYQLPEALELGKWDSLDIETGTLTIGTGTYTFTGDENLVSWTSSEMGFIGVYINNVVDYDNSPGNDIRGVCNMYDVIVNSRTDIDDLVGLRQLGDGSQRVYLKDIRFANAEAWKQYLKDLYIAGTPLVLTYKRKTPIVQTIDNVKAGYSVFNGGIESVYDHVPNTSKKFELDTCQYGVYPHITQVYFESDAPEEAATNGYVDAGLADKADKFTVANLEKRMRTIEKTNEISQDIVAYVDQKAADAIESSNTYAEGQASTKASEAERRAKSYADAIETNAKNYATTAEQNANEYTNGKIGPVATNADAAKSLATAANANANNALTKADNANATANNALTKANEAEQNAKEYTDKEAANAEKNAKAHADSIMASFAAYIKILNDWDTTETNCSSMFLNRTDILAMPPVNTTNVENMSAMFQGCTALTTVPDFNVTSVTTMERMFSGCTALTEVPGFIFVQHSVATVARMFEGCTSLVKVPSFANYNALQGNGAVDYMFWDCSSLVTAPVINLAKVTTMRHTFEGCTSLETVPEMDVSNITDFTDVFRYCTSLKSIGFKNIGASLDISAGTFMPENGEYIGSELNKIVNNLKMMGSDGMSTLTISAHDYDLVPQAIKTDWLHDLEQTTMGWAIRPKS